MADVAINEWIVQKLKEVVVEEGHILDHLDLEAGQEALVNRQDHEIADQIHEISDTITEIAHPIVVDTKEEMKEAKVGIEKVVKEEVEKEQFAIENKEMSDQSHQTVKIEEVQGQHRRTHLNRHHQTTKRGLNQALKTNLVLK